MSYSVDTLNVNTITSSGSGVSLNSKDLTSVGTVTASTLSVGTVTSSGSSISLSGKNLSSVGTINSGAITASGTSTVNLLQGTNIQVKYGASSYSPVTMPMYSNSIDAASINGTTTLATINIAAGLVGTTGDSITVEAWGNANTASNTRTIQLTINPVTTPTYDGFNLVSGNNGMWHAKWVLSRRTTTLCDVLGSYQHGGTSGNFGTIDRPTTSFSSAGSIIIQGIASSGSDFRLRSLIVTFHPRFLG